MMTFSGRNAVSIAASISAIAVAILVGAAGLSLHLGLFDREREYDAVTGWRQSLRGPVAPAAERVVLLGDDMTRSDLIRAELTFSALLGGVNAGINDFDTYQETAFFEGVLGPVGFARVGLIVTPGDIIGQALSRDAAAARARMLPLRIRSPLDTLRNLPAALRRSIPTSEEALVLDQLNRPNRSFRLEASPADFADWTATVNRLAAATANKLFVVMLPHAPQVSYFVESGVVPALHDQVREWCATNGIPFLDLLPALAQEEPFHLYFAANQLAPRGHEVVAAALRSFLPTMAVSMP